MLLREALAIREAEMPEHWLTAPRPRSLLGAALLGQEKPADAARCSAPATSDALSPRARCRRRRPGQAPTREPWQGDALRTARTSSGQKVGDGDLAKDSPVQDNGDLLT